MQIGTVVRSAPGLIVSLLSLVTGSHASAGDQNQLLRESVTRGLMHLQVEGEAWIKERKCVSCHRVGMMTWCLKSAADRGFPVDHDRLTEWINWSWNDVLSEDRVTGETVAFRNLEGVAQLLIGSHDSKNERAEEYESITEIMLTRQENDGCWKPGGQLPQQKRPINETRQVSAIWNCIALHRIHAQNGRVTECIHQVRDSFNKPIKPVSAEWYVARILFADEFAYDSERTQHRNQLSKLQHEDGGWGWLIDESSDALGTGLAVYALVTTGSPVDDPAVQDATAFLLQTQLDDGSWDVYGTKEVARNSIEETACYWGTAWATLSLLQQLPVTNR